MYRGDKKTLQITGFWMGASLLGLWLMFVMPDSLGQVFKDNWICDVICLEISINILLFMYSKSIIDFFSPVIYVSVIYILMFFVTPIYDINRGAIDAFGVLDLFNYGVKGSVVAILGFMSFCLLYSYRYTKSSSSGEQRQTTELLPDSRLQLEKWLLIAWTVDFIFAIAITIATKGFSITYILSFGIFGEVTGTDTTSSSFGFIGQFTRSIVTFFLMYYYISDNKKLKRVLFVLTAFIEMIHGFRYMIVILVIGYFYSAFLIKKKKVNIVYLLLLFILLSVIVGVVGYTRNTVRNGAGFSLNGFKMDDIIYAVIGNFRIYKSYYGVIKAVPALTDYLYFDQILFYTIILAVPRVIWPGKPGNPGTKAQLYGINQYAVNSGFAYPCLGEYYYSFGITGVVFFMGIMGHWLASTAVKYRVNCNKEVDLVIYSVTVSMMLQLLIRGYTPGNFYLVLALYIPYWFVDSYYKKHAVAVNKESELNEQE